MKNKSIFLFFSCINIFVNSVAYDEELNKQALNQLEYVVKKSCNNLNSKTVIEYINTYHPKIDSQTYQVLLTILEINCKKHKKYYQKKIHTESRLVKCEKKVNLFHKQISSSLYDIFEDNEVEIE